MANRELSVLTHDHAVTFYDDDAGLVARIADFVTEGVALGERAVVVATAEHWVMIDNSLLRLGLDPTRARAAGQLLALDAAKTLDTLMRHGVVDPAIFRDSVGDLIDAAAVDGNQVRVFGEMVAILWQRGDVAGALELETLCNELATGRQFVLLCAYGIDLVGEASLDDVDRVCELHSSLVPPQSYLSSAGSAPLVLQGPGRTSQVFVCVPAAVPAVRRFVAKVLSCWGRDDIIPDAVLVASELATNALRHTQLPFRVSLDGSGPSVRIAVEDLGRRRPALCHPSDHATWGRGVIIVNDVSRAWGTTQLPRGKVVWADLKGPV